MGKYLLAMKYGNTRNNRKNPIQKWENYYKILLKKSRKKNNNTRINNQKIYSGWEYTKYGSEKLWRMLRQLIKVLGISRTFMEIEIEGKIGDEQSGLRARTSCIAHIYTIQ